MTRGEFLDAVRVDNIRPDAFSLDGPGNECYALAHCGGRWDVFYSERGLQTGLRHFDAESAALDDLLGRLRKDSSTRS